MELAVINESSAAPMSTPKYTRRVSDKIIIAFDKACDDMDVEVAWELLIVLDFMAMRMPSYPGNKDRRIKESLVEAHQRFWQLRHSSTA